jgi:hypothetical protein
MTKYSTAQIGRKQATNIFHAVRFANDNGRPLNLMVTINLTDLGLSDEKAGDFFRDARARVARWWKYQRDKGRPIGTFDDVAAHAHPPSGRRHVHWLVHVPNGARFEIDAIIESRLRKMLNLDCLGNAVEIKDVGNSGTLAKYILRGTEPAFADYFKMWTSDEGTIIGRRVHASHSISRAGRERAGWKPKRRPRASQG